MLALKVLASVCTLDKVRECYNNIAGAEDSAVSWDEQTEELEKIEPKVEKK